MKTSGSEKFNNRYELEYQDTPDLEITCVALQISCQKAVIFRKLRIAALSSSQSFTQLALATQT